MLSPRIRRRWVVVALLNSAMGCSILSSLICASSMCVRRKTRVADWKVQIDDNLRSPRSGSSQSLEQYLRVEDGGEPY